MVLRLLALAFTLTGTAFAAVPATSTPASAVAVPAIGAAPAVADAPQLSGRVLGDRYFAASGAFSVSVPKLNKDSATIMDSDSIVVFKDQVSVFVSFPSTRYITV